MNSTFSRRSAGEESIFLFQFYLINYKLVRAAEESRNFRIFSRADGVFNLTHQKGKFDHTADALRLILGHKYSASSAARTQGTPFKLSGLFGNLWSSLWTLVRLDELVKPILKKPHREEFIVDKLFVSLLGLFVRADYKYGIKCLCLRARK